MRDVFEQFGLGSFSPFAPPLLVRVVQTQAVEAHAYASTKSRASCCLFPNLLTDGDIGELVLLHLLKSYGARAALYAATCKAFAMLLPRVSQRLMDLGIAYWTGNQPPLKPPLLSGAIGTTMASWRSDNAHSRIAQLCHGADVGDVLRLLDGQWCTNFTMSLIIKSSGMDQDIVMTDASPVRSVPRTPRQHSAASGTCSSSSWDCCFCSRTPHLARTAQRSPLRGLHSQPIRSLGGSACLEARRCRSLRLNHWLHENSNCPSCP